MIEGVGEVYTMSDAYDKSTHQAVSVIQNIPVWLRVSSALFGAFVCAIVTDGAWVPLRLIFI